MLNPARTGRCPWKLAYLASDDPPRGNDGLIMLTHLLAQNSGPTVEAHGTRKAKVRRVYNYCESGVV